MRRKTSLTYLEAAVVKLAYHYGYTQHAIASYYGVSPARVSEVHRRKKHGWVVPSRHLPPDFPPMPH